MTKAEYAEYEQAVADFFEREGIANLSSTSPEPFFSLSPCECCGRPEGGDREEANAYNPTTQKVQTYDCICTDCLYFAEYRQLDDTTMQELENCKENRWLALTKRDAPRPAGAKTNSSPAPSR